MSERLFLHLYGHALLERAANQGWWCPTCTRWKAQEEIRQKVVDEVCCEVCRECGTVCEDRRHESHDVPF